MARRKPTPEEELIAQENVRAHLEWRLNEARLNARIAHANGGSFLANGGRTLYEGDLRAEIILLERILGQLP